MTMSICKQQLDTNKTQQWAVISDYINCYYKIILSTYVLLFFGAKSADLALILSIRILFITPNIIILFQASSLSLHFSIQHWIAVSFCHLHLFVISSLHQFTISSPLPQDNWSSVSIPIEHTQKITDYDIKWLRHCTVLSHKCPRNYLQDLSAAKK